MDERKQKYPDGDHRRRFGGTEPVWLRTSSGRGHGEVIERRASRRNQMDERMAHKLGGRP